MKTKLYFLIYIIGVSFLLCGRSNAQTKQEETNLFTYGVPIVSCEDNFSNFFNNFSNYVKNADMIHFLGYQYVDIVKNKRQAKRYVRMNFAPQIPKWISEYRSTIYGKKEENWVFLQKDPMANSYNIKDIVNTIFNEFIHNGDKIYALKFVYEGKTYKYFIFCDSKTQRVVTYGNIFGLKLPQNFLLNEGASMSK